MSNESKAVFLSYASQDAEAAKRICDALRAAGVEVWFDADGGLEHGDEWDAKIRKQVKECVLFIAVISANTQAREEGYFRLEWDLAAERARTIASGVPFILPVVIDDTREPDALVPDRFRSVQWTKLRSGEVPPEVLQRFLKLWSHRTGVLKNEAMEPGRPRPGERGEGAASPTTQPVGRPRRGRLAWIIVAALVALVAAGVFILQRRTEVSPPPEAALMVPRKLSAPFEPLPPGVETKSVPTVPAATSITASDDKSVAVLAFANLSDDKANEYFSDGISEELLNVLAKIPDLKVSARTSAFYFKGKDTPIPEIAQKLGVAYVVEGSVRKQGTKVRITAQLIKAADGFHVWSDTFTRELKDIFAVQDEIAGLIAKNLSLKMGVTARAEHQFNPEALAALLEGRHYWVLRTIEGFVRAEELFNRAVTLDPQWAPAHAALASLLTIRTSYQLGGGGAVSERFELAAQEARRAIELDATLGEPYSTLGKIAMERRRLAEAEGYFRRALALEPNNALIHDWYGDLAVNQGRLDLATTEYRRALELDPLSPYIQWDLAWELMHVRRYAEALTLLEQATALTPNGAPRLTLRRARVLLELGRKAEAEAVLRPYWAGSAADSDPQLANEAVWCLRALGLPAEAERWAADLLRQNPDSYSSGVILLMQGHLEKAFTLLEKTPPIFLQQIYWESVFDPVRDTPRFQQLLAKLNCTEEYKVARDTLARMLKEQAAKK